MALVIVLGAVVLVTLLAVAFLASTSRELTASKSYASGLSARMYADAAVNVVLGQLRAGTTEDDPTKTWTSQPGLVRQFNNQGEQTQVFKLYSSNKMIEAGSFSLLDNGKPSDVPVWAASDAPETLPWNSDPGIYTDLNTPVVVDKKPNYPILNPGGLQTATRIQGLDVAAEFGLADVNDMDGDGDTAEIGQIPMPVRWIYVLKDGSLASAERVANKTIRLLRPDGSVVPDNIPPVSRIAFWTDDDTCKLNVNTASEGNYWTLPVAVAADDSLSSGQVNAREFQRYPGHPAATSLSPALEFLTTNKTDLRNFIFALTPRVSGRGSQFGSRRIGYGKPVELDKDRLYASVDDLLFLPAFDTTASERYRTNTANIKKTKESELDFNFTNPNVPTSTAGTPYNFASAFELDPAKLELLRFFLTAESNAPEVNLFGKPRVSLWPVDTRPTHQSIYDKMLAFCSTVDAKQYYFQRQNPDSRDEDYASIPRNQQLLGYLDQLTAAAIPGLGGKFSDKYTSIDREQLLTSIFDWVRTVNIAYRDPAGAVQPYAWQNNTAASSITGTATPPGLPGSGQVLPIKIGSTNGLGRFPTLSKVALAIVREQELVDQPAPGKTTLNYRVIFLMETYVPMLGYAGFVPNYEIEMKNLNNAFEAVADLTTTATNDTPVAGSEQTFPITFQSGTIKVNVPANIEPFTGRAWGGTQGFNNLLLYNDSSANLEPRSIGSTDPATGYPFVSTQFSVVADSAKKDWIRVGLRLADGASGAADILFRNSHGSELYGSYSVAFPGFGPVHGATLGKSAGSDSKLKPKLQDRVDQMADTWRMTTSELSATGQNENWKNYKTAIGLNDVVRGVELSHGDLRLLALHGGGAGNTFVTHKDYASASKAHAHSLLGSGGTALPFYEADKLYKNRGFLAGASTGFNGGTQAQFFPQAPSSMTKVTNLYTGDFTTGVGSEGDGPHVLKADEGNSSSSGSNWGMSVQQPYQNQLFPWDSRLSEAFSPSRQVASAVQLGTLPAEGATNTPWRTLLFRPNIAAVSHPGASSPADSALLDLFWMPVVDPYPISKPFSTAGKVNMNSQIAPFTYVERSTALLGALKSVRVMAIPAQEDMYYKWSGYTVDASKKRWSMSYLYDVDPAKTLMFFNERFTDANANGNVFRSPTEICQIPLVPKQNVNSVVGTGHTEDSPAHAISTANIGSAGTPDDLRNAVKDFWSKNVLSGDNVMEAPYNHLYPRLTTQSNSYTVHVRAQSLQVPPKASMGNLSENRITVNGEYRGSFSVERYIDPSDTIPDFTQAANFSKTLNPYYKFRIKASRQFLPQ